MATAGMARGQRGRGHNDKLAAVFTCPLPFSNANHLQKCAHTSAALQTLCSSSTV